jgi:hypothetical protein
MFIAKLPLKVTVGALSRTTLGVTTQIEPILLVLYLNKRVLMTQS